MSTGSSTQVTRRGVFPRLRDARIRAKLALILFVPLAAVIVLATARLVDVSGQATTAGQVVAVLRIAVAILIFWYLSSAPVRAAFHPEA